MNISSQSVDRILAAAKQKALNIGVPMNVAVVDGGGNLKAFVRMDGAVLGSIDIALKKAKTAALFQSNTETLFEYCKPGGPAYGLENTNGGIVVFAGGIPLKDATGECIGAIGVSGGAVPQDKSVAEAGASALSYRGESQPNM